MAASAPLHRLRKKSKGVSWNGVVTPASACLRYGRHRQECLCYREARLNRLRKKARTFPQGLKSLCGYFKINSSAAEAVVQMQDLCRSPSTLRVN